jgi:glycosyltransferase involved in cell wall biosynthesis
MISVVIPYRAKTEYDNFPALQRVIRSVQGQLYDHEIIISVYGAMDERVKELGETIVHTPTAGPWNRSAALNAGIAIATGDNIFCLDADCELVRHDVLREIESAIDNPGYHIVYRITDTGRVNFHGSGMQAFRKVDWVDRKWDEQYQGYGREDIDYLETAKHAGEVVAEMFGGIQHIDHPRAFDTPEIMEMWAENKRKFAQKWAA